MDLTNVRIQVHNRRFLKEHFILFNLFIFDGLWNYLYSCREQPGASFFKNIKCYFSEQWNIGRHSNKFTETGLQLFIKCLLRVIHADFCCLESLSFYQLNAIWPYQQAFQFLKNIKLLNKKLLELLIINQEISILVPYSNKTPF